MKHSTNLIIISGPSGSGKDSVIEGMAKRGLPIERVITTVTRPKRTGESEGNPYYFVSDAVFRAMMQKGELAEWAEVDNGRLYGVANKELERVKNMREK